MTIVGLHDFVKVSISASLRSFLLIMCIDAPESITNSLSSSLKVDASKPLFSEDEKNVALSCSLNFKTLLSASTLLRGLLALVTLSPPETDAILEHWGCADDVHLGKYIRTKDLVSHVIGFRVSDLFRGIDEDFGGSRSDLEIRIPIVAYLTNRIQRVSRFYRIVNAYSTEPLHFNHHSFWTFCLAVHQSVCVHKSTFPQICNRSWSCRPSILECVIFHKMNWSKFL